MQRHLIVSAILAGTAGLVLAHPTPASALTMKECSAKYKAAQTAGTLGSTSWNDFRKAQCGSTASAAPAPAPTATSPTPPATTGAVAPPTHTNPSAARPAAPMARGNAVFPTAVSSKYSTESAGKARMHTCLDQYKANETGGGNGNGGLKWIEKGGGYYSQCNARLKG
ncbi:hypothetical protein MicloDRAFT_00020420 [Microvirga lotononidis]|uniref:Uncharacterized protein n=2 Tax=Microvirga lotononidis TaxID=864069 RepID=I4Z019_9HYPH|nr:hypothetical protein MicloDRAFT_00020420 [Microvirga lotononidis]